MLLMVVSLLSYVTATKTCLQCDSSIRTMHEDFILSAPSVEDQIELKKIRDQAYVTYRETSQERKGVIDPTTLYRAKTAYQSEFHRFLKTELTGTITFETIQIMEKGRTILEKYLDDFIPTELCPNVCGLLKRRVMDCLSCRYKIYTCPSPTGQQDCVIPLPPQTQRPLVTLPSLPHGDSYSPFQPTEDLLVTLIAVVTALSLTASVGLTVVLGLMMNQQRAATELR